MRRGCHFSNGRWWALVLALLAGGGIEAAHPLAEQVVIVANANDPESLEIARAYQAFRGIPENNLIALPMSGALATDRATFVAQIFNPLRAALIERGLVEGVALGEPDALGRIPVFIGLNRVRYVVLCRGVPLRVNGGGDAQDEFFPAWKARMERGLGPGRELPSEFQRSAASVDSELVLLLQDEVPVRGFIQSPFFGRLPLDWDSRYLIVNRLDGPDVASVLNMLEGVRTVEARGLRGRAYFDLRGIAEGKPLREGDDWIEASIPPVRAMGYERSIDRAGPPMDVAQRLDAAAIYVGWYARDQVGPFTLPGFRFAPGAIALHLHSFSAADPRSTERGWVGPMIAQGAAATVGNVAEPYLQFTHRFQVIVGGMAAGHNFGDAAFAAINVFSWVNAVFGDPLYQPFAVPDEVQFAAAEELAEPALDVFGRMREINLVAQHAPDGASQALARSRALLEEADEPALRLYTALREDAAGHRRAGLALLEPLAEVEDLPAPQWGLYREIARTLSQWDATDAATAIYRQLLRAPAPPRAALKTFLREGVAVARHAAPSEAALWQARLTIIEEAERIEREQAKAAKEALEAEKAAEKKTAQNP